MTGATGDWKGDYWWCSGVTFNNGLQLGYGITGYGVKDITVNNDATPTYMLIRKLRGLQDGTYTYTFPYSSIKQDENLYLKLSIDTYVNTRNYYNILTPADTVLATEIQSIAMNNIEIKIGKYWWNGSTGKWQTSRYYSGNKIEIRDKTQKLADSRVNDRWVSAEMFIPINEASASNITEIVGGDITVLIFTGVIVSDIKSPYPQTTGQEDIQNIFIKNIKVELVDTAHQPIQNNGVQTILDLSNATTRKRTPISIQLKCDCGVYGSSKGAFASTAITPSGNNISGLKRIGGSSYYNTAKLLGQDLISQYNSPKKLLSANLDVQQYLLSIENKLITDNKYLPGKAFYIFSGTYNDANESMNTQMIEITKARENIE
jgi:hypothetical protein